MIEILCPSNHERSIYLGHGRVRHKAIVPYQDKVRQVKVHGRISVWIRQCECVGMASSMIVDQDLVVHPNKSMGKCI